MVKSIDAHFSRAGWLGSVGVIGAALAFAAMPVIAAQKVPQTMHAIHVDPAGAPGAMKLDTVPVPKPGDGQVLIRVYAAGTNPADWGLRPAPAAGAAPPSAPQPPRPAPGHDLAGVIVELGSGVSDHKIGEKVYTTVTGGAYAEYAVAPAADLAMKPEKFTFEQAAGIPISGYAGLRLALVGDIKPGERVLVIGAAGGVGSTALQAAHAAGGHIIAVASSRHHKYLESLGAHEIIDYDKEDVAQTAKAVAVVLNTVDSENAKALSYVHPEPELSVS